MRSRPLLTVVVVGLIAGCGGGSKRTTAATGPPPAGNSAAALPQDAEAKSSARVVETALETCYTDSRSYKGCDIAGTLGGQAPSLGSGPGQVEVKATNQTYTVTARSRSGAVFTISGSGQGSIKRTCTGANPAGGCTGGSW